MQDSWREFQDILHWAPNLLFLYIVSESQGRERGLGVFQWYMYNPEMIIIL